MGGSGDLLSLSLNVPPWEDLHERTGGIAAHQSHHHGSVAEVLPQIDRSVVPVAEYGQAGAGSLRRTVQRPTRQPDDGEATKTAEAIAPTGGVPRGAGPAIAGTSELAEGSWSA